MKHINKTIFATTLLTSFFLGQPVLADMFGKYPGDEAISLQSKKINPIERKTPQEQAVPAEKKVNYQLQEVTSLDELASGRK